MTSNLLRAQMDSALKRMPPEMLAEIFSWTLAPATDAIDRERYRSTDSPWVLTRVNRRWRAVTISNPSLWSLVVIAYQPGLDSSTSYPLSMIETQISRAHKLKVHFHGCETSDPLPQIENFKCVVKHASHWEELSLTLTSFLSPLLEGLQGHVPLLERLAIELDDEESEVAVSSIDCFKLAPSLADVSLTYESRFIPFSFPTGQLTRYELDATWEIHRGVLNSSPNLVEARINICFDDMDWLDPDDRIELLHLRRLYVSHSRVLTFLKLSLLEELSLSLYDIALDPPQNTVIPDDDDGGLADLESSLMSSSFFIRRLCFTGCSNPHRIAVLLQKYSSIVEFAIITHTLTASAQAAILMDILNAETAGSRIVAPQLCRVVFGCIDQGSLDYSRFLKLVKYRWETKSCALNNAALLTETGPSPEAAVLDSLGALRTAGLDFVWLNDNDWEASIAIDYLLCYSQWA